MEKKKLRNAVWVSYWGVPVLVTVFVVTYWIIGLKNYHNKGEVAQEEKEEEEEGGSSLWMVLGVIVAFASVFAALLWWIYPVISSRLQRKKKTSW